MAIALIAFAVVVGGVLSLTLFGGLPRGLAVPELYLDPLEGAWGWSTIAWGPILDNLLLFVPVGALAAAVWWRRSVVLIWLACVAFSAGIELFQYAVPSGRVANTADVLANAAGAALGVVLTVLLRCRVGPQQLEVRRTTDPVRR
ncbi:MAG: VanZ family protein [Nitriliruptoraceae bacterium]